VKKKKPPISAFDTWFKAQFGSRPSALNYYNLAKLVDNARARYHELVRHQSEVKSWDNAQRAASYAWNARDGKK
jgi:hypothetical protein